MASGDSAVLCRPLPQPQIPVILVGFPAPRAVAAVIYPTKPHSLTLRWFLR
jgi:hypothetical protein